MVFNYYPVFAIFEPLSVFFCHFFFGKIKQSTREGTLFSPHIATQSPDAYPVSLTQTDRATSRNDAFSHAGLQSPLANTHIVIEGTSRGISSHRNAKPIHPRKRKQNANSLSDKIQSSSPELILPVSRLPDPNQVKPSNLLRSWRVLERMRTVHAVLVLCLNVGVDPPDVDKPKPCAKRECWIDPEQFESAQDAAKVIAQKLQNQYCIWDKHVTFKYVADPTINELRRTCMVARRNAREERLLFHYNGHGVPKPTVNGEIWVFNRDYTQYIPLSLYDVQDWIGVPALYIFDCNGAGLIVKEFLNFAKTREAERLNSAADDTRASPSGPRHDDAILLAACGDTEELPTHPSLPADLFTSCLTTPIRVSLLWALQRTTVVGVTEDMLDEVPGDLKERNSPLGQLNWIFTAVTDAIAWNVLPHDLFKRLFRQDVLLASLMRNFLLANRLMRSMGCTPVSWPPLPRTHDHPMWRSYDQTLEMCLQQMPNIRRLREADDADAQGTRLWLEAAELEKVYIKAYKMVGEHVQSPSLRGTQLTNLTHRSYDSDEIHDTSDERPPPIAENVSTGSSEYQLTFPCPGYAATTIGELDSNSCLPPPSFVTGSLRGYSESEYDFHSVEFLRTRKAWFEKYSAATESFKKAESLRMLCYADKYLPIPFFEESMKSFSTWLSLNSDPRALPLHLPVMLQILLSQSYREEALKTLSRYVQVGPRAVELVLSAGYFPYFQKLLHTTSLELQQDLVFIWAKIILVDPTTCIDLVKENGEVEFVYFLTFASDRSQEIDAVCLAMAFFILTFVARESTDGGLISRYKPDLFVIKKDSARLTTTAAAKADDSAIGPAPASAAANWAGKSSYREDIVHACHKLLSHDSGIVRRWACLCLNDYCVRFEDLKKIAVSTHAMLKQLVSLMKYDSEPDTRAAAIMVTSTLVQASLPSLQLETNVATDNLRQQRSSETCFASTSTAVETSDSAPDLSEQSEHPKADQSCHGSDKELDKFSLLPLFSSGLLYVARNDSSPLSKHEAVAALLNMARYRVDLFHHGLRMIASEPQLLHDFLKDDEFQTATNMPLACVCLYEALSMFYFDVHPIIEAGAHQIVDLVQHDAFSASSSDQFGNYSDSSRALQAFSSDNSLPNLPTGKFSFSGDIPHSEQSAAQYDEFRAVEMPRTKSPGLFELTDRASSTCSPSMPLNRPYSHSSSQQGVGSMQDQGSLSEFPHELRHASHPVVTASTSHMYSNTADTCSDRSSGKPSLNVPKWSRRMHLRSGSGTFDIPGLDVEEDGLSTRSSASSVDGTRGDGVHRVNGAGFVDTSDLSTDTSRRHSVSVPDGRGSGANSAKPLPIYPVQLATGVGRLIRNVSQTFLAGGSSASSANKRDISAKAISEGTKAHTADKSRSRDIDNQSCPNLADLLNVDLSLSADSSLSRSNTFESDSGNASGLVSSHGTLRARRPRSSKSYQLLSAACSPIVRDHSKLPMPRTSSFLMGPDEMNFEGIERTVSKDERLSCRKGVGGIDSSMYVKNLYSLYDWSYHCISLMKIDADSRDGMPSECIERDHDAATFDAEVELTDDLDPYFNFKTRCYQGDIFGKVFDIVDAHDPWWSKRVRSCCLEPANGAILSMTFQPQSVGPGMDSLLIVGDSHGSVSFLSTRDGSRFASFEIPGAPDDCEYGVTSVISLNSLWTEELITNTYVPYEPAICIAGSIDGRIGIFKCNLGTKKHSIVGAFQGSGFVDYSGKSRSISVGRILTSAQRAIYSKARSSANPSENLRRFVRLNGRGLVLSLDLESYHLVAGGCQEGVVRLWDLNSERIISRKKILRDDDVITSMTCSSISGTNVMFFGSSNGNVGLRDFREGSLFSDSNASRFEPHHEPVVSSATRCVGGCESFLSADISGRIRLWDPRRNEPLAENMRTGKGDLTSIDISGIGYVAAVASSQSHVDLFGMYDSSMRTLRHDQVLIPTTGSAVMSVAFQRELNHLAVGCSDSTVTVFGQH